MRLDKRVHKGCIAFIELNPSELLTPHNSNPPQQRSVRRSCPDPRLMSSHFKKFLSQRKQSIPPAAQSPGLSSAPTPPLPASRQQGSPPLPNASSSTASSSPNASQISLPRRQRHSSASSSMQESNPSGRPPSYTHAILEQQRGASPPVSGRTNSPMPPPPVNTQHHSGYSLQQIQSAPPHGPPRPAPTHTQSQYDARSAPPVPTAPYRPRALVEAEARANNKSQLIVGIDFVRLGWGLWQCS
jgi:hypothetical protein